jgi:hypothetical protein
VDGFSEQERTAPCLWQNMWFRDCPLISSFTP